MKVPVPHRVAKQVLAGLISLCLAALSVTPSLAEGRFWEERERVVRRSGITASGSVLHARRPMTAYPDFSSSVFASPLKPIESGGVGHAPVGSVGGEKGIPPWLRGLPAGEVRYSSLMHPRGPSAPWVVLIQDVHGAYDAQRSVSAILASIHEQSRREGRGEPVYGIEGAAGAFDLSPVRLARGEPRFGMVSDLLLRLQLLTGPEHFALSREVLPFLWGVESPRDYRANVESYRRGRTLRPETDRALDQREEMLSRRGAPLFDDRLNQLNAGLAAESRGDLPLADYVDLLKRHQPRLSAWPAVARLALVLQLEKTIDFKAAEQDRERLIQDLITGLSPKGLERLAKSATAFRAGGLTPGAYWTQVKTLTGNAVDWGRFPAFEAYCRYALQVDAIDSVALQDQLVSLRAMVVDAVSPRAARDVIQSLEDVRRLRRLVQRNLTPAEWRELQRRPKEIRALDDRLSSVPGPGLGEIFESHKSFYEDADRRSLTLAKNLLEKMGDRNASLGVLVAGGFHSADLIKAFDGHVQGVVTVTPRLTDVAFQGGDSLSGFMGARLSLDQILVGARLFLAPDHLGAAAPLLGEENNRTRNDLLEASGALSVAASVTPDTLAEAFRGKTGLAFSVDQAGPLIRVETNHMRAVGVGGKTADEARRTMRDRVPKARLLNTENNPYALGWVPPSIGRKAWAKFRGWVQQQISRWMNRNDEISPFVFVPVGMLPIWDRLLTRGWSPRLLAALASSEEVLFAFPIALLAVTSPFIFVQALSFFGVADLWAISDMGVPDAFWSVDLGVSHAFLSSLFPLGMMGSAEPDPRLSEAVFADTFEAVRWIIEKEEKKGNSGRIKTLRSQVTALNAEGKIDGSPAIKTIENMAGDANRFLDLRGELEPALRRVAATRRTKAIIADYFNDEEIQALLARGGRAPSLDTDRKLIAFALRYLNVSSEESGLFTEEGAVGPKPLVEPTPVNPRIVNAPVFSTMSEGVLWLIYTLLSKPPSGTAIESLESMTRALRDLKKIEGTENGLRNKVYFANLYWKYKEGLDRALRAAWAEEQRGDKKVTIETLWNHNAVQTFLAQEVSGHLSTDLELWRKPIGFALECLKYEKIITWKDQTVKTSLRAERPPRPKKVPPPTPTPIPVRSIPLETYIAEFRAQGSPQFEKPIDASVWLIRRMESEGADPRVAIPGFGKRLKALRELGRFNSQPADKSLDNSAHAANYFWTHKESLIQALRAAEEGVDPSARTDAFFCRHSGLREIYESDDHPLTEGTARKVVAIARLYLATESQERISTWDMPSVGSSPPADQKGIPELTRRRLELEQKLAQLDQEISAAERRREIPAPEAVERTPSNSRGSEDGFVQKAEDHSDFLRDHLTSADEALRLSMGMLGPFTGTVTEVREGGVTVTVDAGSEVLPLIVAGDRVKENTIQYQYPHYKVLEVSSSRGGLNVKLKLESADRPPLRTGISIPFEPILRKKNHGLTVREAATHWLAERLARNGSRPTTTIPVLDMLFGLTPPVDRTVRNDQLPDDRTWSDGLSFVREVVDAAAGPKPVVFIEPLGGADRPGVMAEIIDRLVQGGDRVLVVSPDKNEIPPLLVRLGDNRASDVLYMGREDPLPSNRAPRLRKGDWSGVKEAWRPWKDRRGCVVVTQTTDLQLRDVEKDSFEVVIVLSAEKSNLPGLLPALTKARTNGGRGSKIIIVGKPAGGAETRALSIELALRLGSDLTRTLQANPWDYFAIEGAYLRLPPGSPPARHPAPPVAEPSPDSSVITEPNGPLAGGIEPGASLTDESMEPSAPDLDLFKAAVAQAENGVAKVETGIPASQKLAVYLGVFGRMQEALDGVGDEPGLISLLEQFEDEGTLEVLIRAEELRDGVLGAITQLITATLSEPEWRSELPNVVAQASTLEGAAVSVLDLLLGESKSAFTDDRVIELIASQLEPYRNQLAPVQDVQRNGDPLTLLSEDLKKPFKHYLYMLSEIGYRPKPGVLQSYFPSDSALSHQTDALTQTAGERFYKWWNTFRVSPEFKRMRETLTPPGTAPGSLMGMMPLWRGLAQRYPKITAVLSGHAEEIFFGGFLALFLSQSALAFFGLSDLDAVVRVGGRFALVFLNAAAFGFLTHPRVARWQNGKIVFSESPTSTEDRFKLMGLGLAFRFGFLMGWDGPLSLVMAMVLHALHNVGLSRALAHWAQKDSRGWLRRLLDLPLGMTGGASSNTVAVRDVLTQAPDSAWGPGAAPLTFKFRLSPRQLSKMIFDGEENAVPSPLDRSNPVHDWEGEILGQTRDFGRMTPADARRVFIDRAVRTSLLAGGINSEDLTVVWARALPAQWAATARVLFSDSSARWDEFAAGLESLMVDPSALKSLNEEQRSGTVTVIVADRRDPAFLNDARASAEKFASRALNNRGMTVAVSRDVADAHADWVAALRVLQSGSQGRLRIEVEEAGSALIRNAQGRLVLNVGTVVQSFRDALPHVGNVQVLTDPVSDLLVNSTGVAKTIIVQRLIRLLDGMKAVPLESDTANSIDALREIVQQA